MSGFVGFFSPLEILVAFLLQEKSMTFDLMSIVNYICKFKKSNHNFFICKLLKTSDSLF